MSYRVVKEDILSISADAAVLSVEISLNAAEGPVCARLEQAGGEALKEALRGIGFLPVGSAGAITVESLPFDHLILTAAPRWLTGKANELLVLHRCYESVFSLAEDLGCKSLAMPVLSAMYYRFPPEEALHIALTEAEKSSREVIFVADTQALLALSGRSYRKPEIISYVGYYRDHAIFALDNGLFARVDLRPEKIDVAEIPYFEACYRTGNNPLQPPLPEAEIARLREIYETYSW